MENEFTTPADILAETPVVIQCRDCGINVIHPIPAFAKWGILCDDCAQNDREKILRDAIEQSKLQDVSGWHRICPACFRDTEPHRLPSPTKLQRVLEWKHGPKGLVLHGTTGAGKTRCLYELLKREFKAGRTVSVLDHSSAYRYGDAFEQGPSAARHWIEHRCTVDILALDDIFKAKLTDSFEQAVFTIISQRTERGLPVLLTTNDVGATLEGRMSKDRGPALVRRIREFCESISF